MARTHRRSGYARGVPPTDEIKLRIAILREELAATEVLLRTAQELDAIEQARQEKKELCPV